MTGEPCSPDELRTLFLSGWSPPPAHPVPVRPPVTPANES